VTAWVVGYIVVALLVVMSAGFAFKDENGPEGWHIGLAIVWPLFIVLVLIWSAYRIGRWLAVKEAK
jgi:hypothetical protein